MRRSISLHVVLLCLVCCVHACSYDPAFDVTCDDEGVVQDGRECRNGIWIAVEDSTTTPDAGPTDLTTVDMTGLPDLPEQGDTSCTPESDNALCARLAKDCDSVTDVDNCGMQRTVTCGECTEPQTCGGGGEPNVCGCTPESDAELCQRYVKTCDDFEQTDNCGVVRTVNCGTCTAPAVCGGGGTANVCACADQTDVEFCADYGAVCGRLTELDVCDVVREVDCGSDVCVFPDTCGDDNQCGCAPESAQEFCSGAGAQCDSVSGVDNCGMMRTEDCGMCAGAVEICINNSCFDDTDGDLVPDSMDNCPAVANANQADFDNDGLGDECDPDIDADGVLNAQDSNDFDPTVCRDADGDMCDDCSNGSDDPANDGADFDGDGLCDAGDPDIDADGVVNAQDSNDFDPTVCRDVDGDTCDDCSSGTDNPANDGPDFDLDGLCDAGDPDIDGDGVANAQDSNDFDPTICRDVDGDTCDDCASGTDNPASDGTDFDVDGLCDAGDPDIDGDGVVNAQDSNDFDPTVCRDVDSDTCDDCSSGTDNPANDGPDSDSDGICDAGDAEVTPVDCTDGVDNDGDGDVDCEDEDCDGVQCNMAPPRTCNFANGNCEM